jgi:hypothetical protein
MISEKYYGSISPLFSEHYYRPLWAGDSRIYMAPHIFFRTDHYGLGTAEYKETMINFSAGIH